MVNPYVADGNNNIRRRLCEATTMPAWSAVDCVGCERPVTLWTTAEQPLSLRRRGSDVCGFPNGRSVRLLPSIWSAAMGCRFPFSQRFEFLNSPAMSVSFIKPESSEEMKAVMNPRTPNRWQKSSSAQGCNVQLADRVDEGTGDDCLQNGQPCADPDDSFAEMFARKTCHRRNSNPCSARNRASERIACDTR